MDRLKFIEVEGILKIIAAVADLNGFA